MLILQGNAVDPEVAVAGGVMLRLQLSDSIGPGGTNALTRESAILQNAEVAWDKQLELRSPAQATRDAAPCAPQPATTPHCPRAPFSPSIFKDRVRIAASLSTSGRSSGQGGVFWQAKGA